MENIKEHIKDLRFIDGWRTNKNDEIYQKSVFYKQQNNLNITLLKKSGNEIISLNTTTQLNVN